MTVCFVTGTDTGVGKTVVTAALAAIWRARGHDVAVVKPAQTGVRPGQAGDVDEVRRLAGPLDAREGIRLPDPLAPVRAALVAGVELPGLGAHAGVPVLGAIPEGAATLQPSDFQARAPGWIELDRGPQP